MLNYFLKIFNGNTNWQDKLHKIHERGMYLLKCKKMHDCQFLVGTAPNQKLFSAHKLILAMASPVFEAMFYGNMPEQSDPIEVPDINPETFQDMLDYIYGDVMPVKWNDSVYLGCFYVGSKYMLQDFMHRCTTKLSYNLTVQNALMAYECGYQFDKDRLMKCSIWMISQNIQNILSQASFNDIQYGTLLDILDQDTLMITSELELFNAVQRYATKHGVSQAPTQNLEAVQVLTEPQRITVEYGCRAALKKIRFLTLTTKEFAAGPARSQLLLQQEKHAILMRIINPRDLNYSLPEGFCTSERKRKWPDTIPMIYRDTTNKLQISKFWGILSLSSGIYFATQTGILKMLLSAVLICHGLSYI